jgi:hypothetical protein
MMPPQNSSRRIGAILGFLLKGEVDAIFKQQPFELRNGNIDAAQAWRASHDAVRLLGPTPTNVQVGLLDESQFPIIKEIRARKTFAKYYEAVDDYHFAVVPINSLLTPQWFADLDYVDEVASQIEENAPLESLIRFTMAEGIITQPIVSGAQVVFASLRPDICADQIPTVREVESGEFEIVVRASGRPNYVSVASIGGRLLLTNGVHRVCALSLRGFDSVPCLLRNVSRMEETGLRLQTSLFRPELLSGSRPALVLDFLNEKVAVPLWMRSMYHILRIGIGVEPIQIPAIPSAHPGYKLGTPRQVPTAAGLKPASAERPTSAI